MYNSVLYGNEFKISVIDSRTNKTVVSHVIKIKENGGHEALLHMSQRLANDKFRKVYR